MIFRDFRIGQLYSVFPASVALFSSHAIDARQTQTPIQIHRVLSTYPWAAFQRQFITIR